MIGRFHVLTDFHFQQRFSHAELARMAISGGADTIQFRQKEGNIRHVIHELQQTAEVCVAAGVPLIVDDRVDLALLDGVAGIHLGQTDFPLRLARKILGDDAIIGATATTPDQARRAEDEGASYVGFGPIFPTRSKSNAATVKGLDGLRAATEAVDIPVIAIAGLTPERVWSTLSAGAHGVAVMSAITNADDPEAAARRFAKEIASLQTA
jgi:thiamine-phosphate pyrophosphorylase